MGRIMDFLVNIFFMVVYDKMTDMFDKNKNKKIEIKIPKELK